MNDQTPWDGGAMAGWDETFRVDSDEERKRLVDALVRVHEDLPRCFRKSFIDDADARRVLSVLAGHSKILSSTGARDSRIYKYDGMKDFMLFILEMCGLRDLESIALLTQAKHEMKEELKHGRPSGS